MTYSWNRKGQPVPNLKILKKIVEKAAGFCDFKYTQAKELSISFVDEEMIRKVNREFLGREYMTDVICFNYNEGGSESNTDDPVDDSVASDIIICVDKAIIESEERKIPFHDELVLYIVHGLLHAAGYDDIQEENKKEMRKMEEKIIKSLKEEFDFSQIIEETE